jgi:putative ABC transport system substrate-binding protein
VAWRSTLTCQLVIVLVLLVGTPLHAQQQRVPHVGMLNYAGPSDVRAKQFSDALRALGYLEGSNLKLTHRWADGKMDELPVLAAQLVADKVDIIIALGPAVWAARNATTTIPIVIAFSGDPVGQNVVASLAKPGGNITGFSYMSTDLAEKRLELLSRNFSKAKRVAILFSVQEPATALELKRMDDVAPGLGVSVIRAPVARPDDLDKAFSDALAQGADTMTVLTHGFAVLNADHIVALAAKHRMPVLYGWHDFVAQGGLMSYGPDIELLVRRAAGYVDRMLRGEKPANLPVEQPARLLLSINMKTAKAIGVEVPEALLLRADRIVE